MEASQPSTPLREWFELHGSFLYCWIRARLNPRLRHNLDAEDLLQEVWVRAARQVERQSIEHPRAWLLGIAGNVVLEALRRWQRQPLSTADVATADSTHGFDVPDDVTSLTRRIARDELRQRFFASLDELPDDERLLLVQHGLEERPMADVAPQLGIGIEAGHKRWQRLRDRLRGLGAPLDLG